MRPTAAARYDRPPGEISLRPGERLQQLPLGVVGVLKLVHENAAVSTSDLGKDRGMFSKEPEGQGDLIPEVHPPLPGDQLLVLLVRQGDFSLAPGLFLQ